MFSSDSNLLLVKLLGEVLFNGVKQILVGADQLLPDFLDRQHRREDGDEIIFHLHSIVVHQAV